MRNIILFLCIAMSLAALQVNISGCAQILTPTGGPKDTIPPKLINANPAERTTNFTGKNISLNFDEYVQLEEIPENVIVSPAPKRIPNIDYKLKTITIRLKDTLLPNTTYSINFGNAIKDLNEGNAFRKYTYVFSTGSYIDSLQYAGKVFLAETGKTDSTLQVYLYRNAPDSAVETRRPDYISKVDSSGSFKFLYLPGGTYKVYALKDGDGSRSYNSKSEVFAFLNRQVLLDSNKQGDTLFAYAEEKEKPKAAPVTVKPKISKQVKLKYTVVAPPASQDLLNPFSLAFNQELKNVDLSKIKLTDTMYHQIKIDSIKIDSSKKTISVFTPWEEDTWYKILLPRDLGTDTLGNMLPKSDTLKFRTKNKSDYGTLKLHFKNLKIENTPVLQFIMNNEIIKSYRLGSPDWSIDLIEPNDYELRILYDINNNGRWDPGNYHLKLQPEKVIGVKKKITIRPNFDSDVDIEL